jgi:hypothetical protein
MGFLRFLFLLVVTVATAASDKSTSTRMSFRHRINPTAALVRASISSSNSAIGFMMIALSA